MPDERPSPEVLGSILAEFFPDIHFGTSTWTYPGWQGIVYDEYPEKATAAEMLARYARYPLFSSVGIDSFFYRPPDAKTLKAYAGALPAAFPCCSKVWQDITAHTFKGPNAAKAGLNLDWLNAELFVEKVVAPMQESFADHMGPLILELEALPKNALGAPLPERLDEFFSRVPNGPRYAVELRNPELLTPDYFATLRKHNVAHVFNAWTRMPTIGEQFLMHDAITADFIVSRALLSPGRKYKDAVDAFAPYDRIQQPNPQMREDLVALAGHAIRLGIPAHVIVNNRAEGSAPETIRAVVEMLVEGVDD